MDDRREIDQEPASTPPAAGPGAVTLPPGYLYRELRRAVLLTFGLILLWHMAAPLATLILFFLLVFILAAVLNPVAGFFQRRGIPRVATAITMVLLVVGSLALLVWLALPPLLAEITDFLRQVNVSRLQARELYQQFAREHPELGGLLPPPDRIFREFTPDVSAIVGRLGRYAMTFATGLFSIIILLVLVVYAVGYPEPLVAGFLSAVPARYRSCADAALRRSLEQLQVWAWSALLLGVIVGVMTGVGLWGIEQITGHDIPSVAVFSIIAGVGELIPNVGPIVSAIPPMLVALTIDPTLALWIAGLFLVVQQLENNLIVPLVMGKNLRLHPVSVVAALLIMHTLFGLLGALMAVPVVTIVKVCWEEFYLKPRNVDVPTIEEEAANIVRDRPANPARHPGPC